MSIFASISLYKYIFKINSELKSEKPIEEDYNAIQTRVIVDGSYSIENSNIDKYKITNMDELRVFYSLISPEIVTNSDERSSNFVNSFEINEKDFEENTIFIHYIEEGSGSNKNTFIGVNLENKEVDFIINSESPMIGTTDRAYWYFIAIIPSKYLDGVNTYSWNIP